jgi:probable rRNA maturation factor
MNSFTLTHTVKKYPTGHPYGEMKRKILGPRYDLSLAFVGKTRAATLNRTYRQKTYSPNVLSFPLTENAGEIIICPQVAKGEAAKFDLSADGYVAYLFIHGLLHLKGYDHSDTMEKMEQKYLKAFNIS